MSATATDKQTILVLGCGRKQDPKFYGLKRANGDDVTTDEIHWVTLDMDPYVEPKIVATLGIDAIPLPDDSVDLVIAMHVLEHIGTQGQTKEWFQFWEEAYRILKPDGRLQFECPLSSSVWAWADPTHVRAINEYCFLYFNQNAYREAYSAIPTYRVRADFVPEVFDRRPDAMNADVRKLETHSMLAGVLRARKPFKGWWEDVK